MSDKKHRKLQSATIKHIRNGYQPAADETDYKIEAEYMYTNKRKINKYIDIIEKKTSKEQIKRNDIPTYTRKYKIVNLFEVKPEFDDVGGSIRQIETYAKESSLSPHIKNMYLVIERNQENLHALAEGWELLKTKKNLKVLLFELVDEKYEFSEELDPRDPRLDDEWVYGMNPRPRLTKLFSLPEEE